MVSMYMSSVFSFPKNKAATPIRRFSAAFTALQQEPCLLSVAETCSVKGKDEAAPGTTQQEGVFPGGGGGAKAEMRWQTVGFRGLKSSHAASSSRFCSSED